MRQGAVCDVQTRAHVVKLGLQAFEATDEIHQQSSLRVVEEVVLRLDVQVGIGPSGLGQAPQDELLEYSDINRRHGLRTRANLKQRAKSSALM